MNLWLAATDTGSRVVGYGLSRLFRQLHENNRDDLVQSTQIGLIMGAFCSLPALVVGYWKSIPLGPVFWVVTLAGGAGTFFGLDELGGLAFGMPAGVMALIYVLVRPDPRKVAANPEAYKFPVLPTLFSVVLCLLVLPHVFTSRIVTELPDTRGWLEKLRGDSVPSRIDDVTNWETVVAVTLVAAFLTFLITCGRKETGHQSAPFPPDRPPV